MARWQLGKRYEQRAATSLDIEDRLRASRFLNLLSLSAPHIKLQLRQIDGYEGVLWECRAGGQNKCILRSTRDEAGDLFIVEDVGPW